MKRASQALQRSCWNAASHIAPSNKELFAKFQRRGSVAQLTVGFVALLLNRA